MLKSIKVFTSHKNFLLILVSTLLIIICYKCFIKVGLMDLKELNEEITSHERLNYENKIEDISIKKYNIERDIEEKQTELNDLQQNKSSEIANNTKKTTNEDVEGFININSYNTLYFLSKLASNMDLKISDFKFSNSTLDCYLYGDYQDILLYFQIINNLNNSFSVNNFNIHDLIINKDTNTPSIQYETEEKNYEWSDGKTTKIIKQLPLFYYEDEIIRLKEEKQLKIEKDSQIQAIKMVDGLDLLISKYSKSKNEINELMKLYANKYEVPVSYVFAVADIESGFNCNKINYNSNGTVDRGLMQINSNTANSLSKILNIDYVEGLEFYPDFNIDMGVKYLKSIIDNNPTEELDFIFTSYNKGINGANKIYEETNSYESEYSLKVLDRVDKYKELDDEEILEVPNDYKNELKMFRNELLEIYNKKQKVDTEEKHITENIKTQVGIDVEFNINGDFLLNEDIEFSLNGIEKSKNDPFKYENKPIQSLYIGNDGKKDTTKKEEYIKYNNPYKEDLDYIREEIKRAREAIENRRILGLSINNQINYLKDLLLKELSI